MNNRNFTGSINQLYINGIENELRDLEEEISNQLQPTILKLKELASNEKEEIDITDMVSYISYINSKAYFEAGFRKAMNLMLDTLVGGATPQ